jgi:putative ABC transport system permease protein
MLSVLASVTWKQWWLHRLRTGLTLLGIALGVAVFFAVRTANLTLLSSLSLTIEKLAGKSTLQVIAGESGFPEEVWEIVRDTPGVKIAAPVIEVIAHTAYADAGNLLIVGEDTLGEQGLREFTFDESATEMSDPLIYLAQPNSIIVSRTFAGQHGLKEGTRFHSSPLKDARNSLFEASSSRWESVKCLADRSLPWTCFPCSTSSTVVETLIASIS